MKSASPLVFIVGVVSFLAIPAWGQSVNPSADGGAATAPRPAVSAKNQQALDAAVNNPDTSQAASDKVLVLSPFQVVDDDHGYYGSNAMSGTRLNTKVEDLAASITVVTKQQMKDFALLDINDLFLYEASTEGSGTYTDVAANSDGIPIDNTQMNPNNANRIRGISSANLSFGNFQTSGRVPIDPISVDAVEINRGPNSSVFGLGNAGGTVNMQPASANLSRNRAEASTRVDSFNGNRTSLDINRLLIPNKLSIRGSVVYQQDGFHLKPSGTTTTRYNGMIKYRPTKYTTISASFSHYHDEGNRPNTTTPLDGISLWQQAGGPTWDPIKAVIHLNGQTLGPYTTANLPVYFATSNNFRSYSTMAIDGSGQISQWMPYQASSSPTDPNASKESVFFVNTSPNSIRTTQPLWAANPAVSSKSVYDWSSINIAAMNFLKQTTNTSLLNVDQIIFNTTRQTLAAQAGYYSEYSQDYARNIMGNASGSGKIGYLNIDANERLANGAPNPFFLDPFLGVPIPISYDRPLRLRTGRLQVAYKLDLSHEKNLLHWLGLQQLSAFTEYKDVVNRTVGYRDVITDSHSYLTDGPGSRGSGSPTVGGGSEIARNYFRYYVGDKNGANVDYAPRDFAPGAYPYTWGDGVTGVFHNETARIGAEIGSDITGAANNTHQELKTYGTVLQSYLFGDHLITTLGVRRDRNYNKVGVAPVFNPDGTINWAQSNQWAAGDWVKGAGNTTSAGAVFRPFPWISFQANVSNSFQPAPLAYDVLLNQLPDPKGKGKDYGISLNLFQNRLRIRLTHYEDRQNDSRAGGTAAGRSRAMEFDFAGSSTNKVNWLNVKAAQWATDAAAAKGQTLTQDQLDTQVAATMGLSLPFYEKEKTITQISETADVLAKGNELEINYNINSYWTTKVNFAEMKSINVHLSPAVLEYLAARVPVWSKITDPETGQNWFTTAYPGTTTSTAQLLQTLVYTPLAVDTALEGKSKPQIRQYKANAIGSVRLAAFGDHWLLKRLTLGGGLRWESKGAIGFYGVQQPPTIVTALDPNRPIYDKGHTYIDAFVSYRARLFNDKVPMTVQLNGRNLQENGRLQATNAYPDGTPWTYRIVDPRVFILSATFEL